MYTKPAETLLKIKVNNEEFEYDLGKYNILGDILKEVKSNQLGENDFISEIIINGENIVEEKRSGLEERPLSEITSLEINTDNPFDISLRVLANMDDFMGHLISLIGESADRFRLADEAEANKQFISCVEGLQTFVGVVDKVKSLNKLDFNNIIYESVPVAKRQAELLEVFSSLHDTQANKDWISVADLLEYELSPLVNDWKEILPLLTAELKKMEGSTGS